jgi:type I restriction enzyme, S subunit
MNAQIPMLKQMTLKPLNAADRVVQIVGDALAPSLLVEHFDVVGDAAGSILSIRRLILTLAVSGRLTQQVPSEGSADSLLATLKASDTSARKRKLEHAPLEQNAGPTALPRSWRWARLLDVASIDSCLVNPADFPDLPHVAPDNIEKGTGRLLGYRTVREDGVTSSNHRFFSGQLVYSKIRPNLSKVVLVDFDGLCSADMYPLTARIDRGFLQRFMLSQVFLDQVVKGDNRLAMPKVNQEQLGAIMVAVPPLAEQRRIVAKVDQLMALCDELEARQAQKRQIGTRLTKWALEALLSAEDPEEFNTAWKRVLENFDTLIHRADGVAGLRRAILELAVRGSLSRRHAEDEPVDTLLANIRVERAAAKAHGVRVPQVPPMDPTFAPHRIPSTWRWARWGDLAVTSDSGWSPQCETRPRSGDEWGVVKVSAVSWEVFKPDENKALPPGIPPRKECVIRRGDFLMSRANTAELVGRSVVVADEPGQLMMSDKIVRCTFAGAVNVEYVNLFNRTASARAHYASNASGTSDSMKNISRDVIFSMPVPLPSRNEQARIVRKVDELMRTCDAVEARLRQAEDWAARFVDAVAQELVAQLQSWQGAKARA